MTGGLWFFQVDVRIGRWNAHETGQTSGQLGLLGDSVTCGFRLRAWGSGIYLIPGSLKQQASRAVVETMVRKFNAQTPGENSLLLSLKRAWQVGSCGPYLVAPEGYKTLELQVEVWTRR